MQSQKVAVENIGVDPIIPWTPIVLGTQGNQSFKSIYKHLE